MDTEHRPSQGTQGGRIPHTRGALKQIKAATQAPPSRCAGPLAASKWLENRCRLQSRVPRVERNQNGFITPPAQGPQSREASEWLHIPCHLGVPRVGSKLSGTLNIHWKKGQVVSIMEKTP